MRRNLVAIALLVALVGFAVPASAYWHHHWGWGWSIGWGWGWGPWWGPGPHRGPMPVEAARSNLAAVSTEVTPNHARVYLEGELIGVADDFDGTPDYLYLRSGHYKLEFRLGGYKSESVEINAEPGRSFPIELKLVRIPGEKATPWYDRPEGLPVGRVFGPKPAAEEGRGKAGPNPSLRQEFREPGREPAKASPVAIGAALDLRVTPANAAVYVDGEMVGTGSELGRLERGLAVAAGRHRVEVVAPGRAPKTVEVEVKEGDRQQVVVELEGGLDKPSGRD